MQIISQRVLPDTGKIPTIPPPLKWAGGKRWLVPHLHAVWGKHQHRRLVEPFVGGMAVTLGLKPESALLNDTNPHLINFYSWLKSGLVVTIEMENDQDQYYRHRERLNQLIREGEGDSQEAAALFYYLNRTGFNGLCRFNSRGEFNVPFGKYKTIAYTRDFTRYRPALAHWELKVGDFSKLRVEPTDFLYVDPAYDVEFTTYSAGGFSWADQVRLAHWLAQLPNPIVASNQATPRILDLYDSLGFDISILDAPRMISCTGDRTPAKEMLATRGI
ncbi:MAG: Dam family site-specific DNA-(adenine-N6)-methyltransferase [Chloroflexia bacterium]